MLYEYFVSFIWYCDHLVNHGNVRSRYEANRTAPLLYLFHQNGKPQFVIISVKMQYVKQYRIHNCKRRRYLGKISTKHLNTNFFLGRINHSSRCNPWSWVIQLLIMVDIFKIVLIRIYYIVFTHALGATL